MLLRLNIQWFWLYNSISAYDGGFEARPCRLVPRRSDYQFCRGELYPDAYRAGYELRGARRLMRVGIFRNGDVGTILGSLFSQGSC